MPNWTVAPAPAAGTIGPKPLQALVAVMRKLLHAIYGILRTDTDFDGFKFRKLAEAA
jgi:hypothetical protein